MNVFRNQESDIKVTLLNDKFEPTDFSFVIPYSFFPFACKHRWIDHAGNVLTPDILKSGLFSVPRKSNEVLYASYPELLDWWSHLSRDEKKHHQTSLDLMNDVFVEYSPFIEASSAD